MEERATQTDPAEAIFDLTDVPTVEEYKKAFLATKGALKSKGGESRPLEMLRVNYRAPDHTVTAGEMAADPMVNLATFKAANLAYGNYAKALCQHFGRELKFRLAILVKFSGGKPGEENVCWTLLPQVVQALEELEWVRPES